VALHPGSLTPDSTLTGRQAKPARLVVTTRLDGGWGKVRIFQRAGEDAAGLGGRPFGAARPFTSIGVEDLMTSRFVRTLARAGALAVALALPVAESSAQSGLEAALEQYNGETIKGYMQPLADVLVANLASGYVTGAGPGKKFTFGLELVAMGAKLDDALRTYAASTPSGFTPATFNTATIFGGPGTVVNHSTISGLSYRGPDGLVDQASDYFPTGAPQLRLGGIMGTELVVRYASSSMVPVFDESDFPSLTLFGVGVEHSISQYFPDLLIDVSAGFSYNSLTFGDIVDLSGLSFGVHAGKDFGLLGLFVGASSDGGSMKLKYTTSDPSAPSTLVDVDLDVKRAMRFSGGASLNLGFLHVFGEAGFGDVNTYSAGLRIGG
jgi:hypothetical protein